MYEHESPGPDPAAAHYATHHAGEVPLFRVLIPTTDYHIDLWTTFVKIQALLGTGRAEDVQLASDLIEDVLSIVAAIDHGLFKETAANLGAAYDLQELNDDERFQRSVDALLEEEK